MKTLHIALLEAAAIRSIVAALPEQARNVDPKLLKQEPKEELQSRQTRRAEERRQQKFKNRL